MDLPVKVIPLTAPHTHTVVFLHGRGDHTSDFISSLDYSRDSRGKTFLSAFPSFRWVFPQAKTQRSAALNGEYTAQWSDIWNVTDFSEREELQAVGLKESVAGLRIVLGREAALLGGRWDCLVLAGISQGAATSVHTLLNLSLSSNLAIGKDAIRRLGAFLGFSCRMPFPGRTLAMTRAVLDLEDVPKDDDVIRNTPVLLEHCCDDPVVLIENGRLLRDTLRGFGAPVTWKEYPRGEHWFNSPAGMDDAVQFLGSVLVIRTSDSKMVAQDQSSSENMELS